MRAASLGLIDFRQARIRDPRWHRYLRVMLRDLSRQTRQQIIDLRYRRHLALVANSRLTDDSYRKIHDALDVDYYDLCGTLTPWEGKGYAEHRLKQVQGNRQDYIKAFGQDPSDPAFKAWEAGVIKQIMDGTLGDEGELAQEDLLTRKLQERILRSK